MVSKHDIFGISSEQDFRRVAMEIFHYQSTENPVYSKYLQLLGKSCTSVNRMEDIPFLPIEFFREHRIVCGDRDAEIIFESSGTTSSKPGKHHVRDADLYRESFTRCFREFYGEPHDYRILALLPSYIERKNSSLVYMADELIRLSGHRENGFFLDNQMELVGTMKRLENSGHPTLLIGVSFALADLAEKHPMKLSHTTVIETGGMKGRRKEMTREDLHGLLKKSFDIQYVHSEYGMTELLSQAWSAGEGIFHTPPWMKIRIRDPYDPFSFMPAGKSGGISIIDLANLNSCSFIATQDIGKCIEGGGFEILGRFDNSDLRGCNLMVE